MFSLMLNTLAVPMGRVETFDGVTFHDCAYHHYHFNETLRLEGTNLTLTAVAPHLPDLVVSHEPSSRRSSNHTFVFHEKDFKKSSSSKTHSTRISRLTSSQNTQNTQAGSHSTQCTVGSSNSVSTQTVSTRTVSSQSDNTDTRNSTFSEASSRSSHTSRSAAVTGTSPVLSSRRGSRAFGFVAPFETTINADEYEEKSHEISLLDTSESAHQTQVESQETEISTTEIIDDDYFVDDSRITEYPNNRFNDTNNSTFHSSLSDAASNNSRNLSNSSTSIPSSTYDEESISKFGNDPTINFCTVDVNDSMDNSHRLLRPKGPVEDEKDMKDVDLRLKQMLAIRERLQTDPSYDSDSTLLDHKQSAGLSNDLVPSCSTEQGPNHNRAHSTAPPHQVADRPNVRLMHERRKLRLWWESHPPTPPPVSTTSTMTTCAYDHDRELVSVMRRSTEVEEADDCDVVTSAVMFKMGAELRKIADDFQKSHGTRGSKSWKARTLLKAALQPMALPAPVRQSFAITLTSVFCWRLFNELLTRLR